MQVLAATGVRAADPRDRQGGSQQGHTGAKV